MLGSNFLYAFVGNPRRCPTLGAPQFVATNGSLLPTPNGNLGADGMASTIAHVLSTLITNPYGSGWFDRYGFENADKCQGQFGPTHLTANGARANIRLGYRDFLIQENWVNDRRGRCAMTRRTNDRSLLPFEQLAPSAIGAEPFRFTEGLRLEPGKRLPRLHPDFFGALDVNVKEVVHLTQPLGNASTASDGRGSCVDAGGYRSGDKAPERPCAGPSCDTVRGTPIHAEAFE